MKVASFGLFFHLAGKIPAFPYFMGRNSLYRNSAFVPPI